MWLGHSAWVPRALAMGPLPPCQLQFNHISKVTVVQQELPTPQAL